MDNQTEYIEKLSAQMVEWDRQIDLLKDKAKSATPENSFDCNNAIATLQFKRDEAAVKLQGISTASGEEWQELKEGTDSIWNEISSNLHDAIMKIK